MPRPLTGLSRHCLVTELVAGVTLLAIALLVLEIGVPAGSENDLLRALVAEWPSCLAYLVSFATIGAVWFGHTVITEYLNFGPIRCSSG